MNKAEQQSNVINEMTLRVAISHAIAGGLFYEMDINEIIRIVKEVADDYKKECKNQIKSITN